MQVWYFIIFSAAIIIGLLCYCCFHFFFFFSFCTFPLYTEAAGRLNYAYLFVGFITEADVSAGIMENFRVLLLCWFFSSSRSLVGEMMSTLGSFGSVWMKSSDAAAYCMFDYCSQKYQRVVKRSGMNLLSCCQYESSLISVFLLSVSLYHIIGELSGIMFHSEFNVWVVFIISLH